MMTKPERSIPPDDPDSAGIEAALHRAAEQALKLARQTGTPCYVMRDGKIVDITGTSQRHKQSPAQIT
ncbi:hypothetical protein [Methylomagnum sp.]